MPVSLPQRTLKSPPESGLAADAIFLSRGLPSQVAELIQRCIAGGRWSDRLPSERRLGRELQVSRGTLRAAFELLRNRGVLISVAGKGNRICRSTDLDTIPHLKGLVGILAPEPLEISLPYFAIRFEHLRELASLRRWKIHRVDGGAYFGARAEAQLERLMKEATCECRVLMHSNELVQRWFEASDVPCIVS